MQKYIYYTNVSKYIMHYSTENTERHIFLAFLLSN